MCRPDREHGSCVGVRVGSGETGGFVDAMVVACLRVLSAAVCLGAVTVVGCFGAFITGCGLARDGDGFLSVSGEFVTCV